MNIQDLQKLFTLTDYSHSLPPPSTAPLHPPFLRLPCKQANYRLTFS